MQHSQRYTDTLATRYALFAGLSIVHVSKLSQRKLVAALYWYQNELSLCESGNKPTLEVFDAGRTVGWRLGLGVALLHIAAITPGTLLCGGLAIVCMPILVLVWSVWSLVLKVIA